MDCDELIVGSGLCALAAALGLPAGRRVCVIAGEPRAGFRHYPDWPDAPVAAPAPGGLGQYWHGVIPTGLQRDLAEATDDEFQSLFAQFYPRSDVRPRLRSPWLFVPWRPIRPLREWMRLRRQRGTTLQWLETSALRFQRRAAQAEDGAIEVRTADGRSVRARRVWLAAGCLDTPALLQRSLQEPLARDRVSDHAIFYLGQVDAGIGVTAPRVERTRDGMWVEARYSEGGAELCSLRPARLAFRELDAGIAQRAVFGLPAGSAVRKLASGASLALISEALYTRLGLFPSAARYSVYAQTVVGDAFQFDAANGAMRTQLAAFRRAGDAARARAPWPALRPSRRPELFLPGIHLHHSLHVERLAAAGVDLPGGSVQVLDSSARADIGPDHHSFKLMLAGWRRARAST